MISPGKVLVEICFLWLTWATLNLYNGNMLRNVSDILVKDVYTPLKPPTPLMTILQHVHHLYTGNVLRNASDVLVKGVNTPPPTKLCI